MVGSKPTFREQTHAEEWANTISHGVGAVLALAGLACLLSFTWDAGPWRLAVAAVYGSSAVLCFAASTVFHAGSNTRHYEVLRRIDHCAIYLLIAGSYTPFTLITLPPAWGWTLFGVIWSLALAGIVMKAVYGTRHDGLSTFLYLGMGWLGVVALYPMIDHLHGHGVGWLAAGGVSYTGGVAFFIWEQLPFHHLIWHLSVLVGASCHFTAVAFYVL